MTKNGLILDIIPFGLILKKMYVISVPQPRSPLAFI